MRPGLRLPLSRIAPPLTLDPLFESFATFCALSVYACLWELGRWSRLILEPVWTEKITLLLDLRSLGLTKALVKKSSEQWPAETGRSEQL